jgi:O-antigen/teichoic acid export membrane protein
MSVNKPLALQRSHDDEPNASSAETRERRQRLPGMRNLIRNSFGLGAARACSLLASVVVLPHLVSDLTPAIYGAWATIVSSIAVLTFADLGVGQSLVNPLTQALDDDDYPRARSLMTTNMILLGACSAFVFLLIIILIHVLPWQSFLSLPSQDGPLLTNIASIQGLLFSIGFALSTGTYVRLAQHRSGRSAVMVMVGSVVGACATLGAIAANADILVVTTLASAGVFLGLFLTTLDLVLTEHLLRPRLNALRRSVARLFLQKGFLFSLQTLSGVVAYTLDTLVVGNALGPVSVTQYTITGRFPLAGLTILLSAIIPIWPMIYHRTANRESLRELLWRACVLFVTPAIVLAIVFKVGAARIVGYLGAGQVHLDQSLVLALCVWVIIASAGSILSYALIGVGRLRLQAGIAVCMAIANLALSVLLVRHIGVSGVMWGTVISYVLIAFPVSLWGLSRRHDQ